MNRTHAIPALLLCLLLAVGCLSGCGASASFAADTIASTPMASPAGNNSSSYQNSALPEERFDQDESFPMTETAYDDIESGSTAEATEDNLPDFAEKIIYSGYVTIETTAFDSAVAALEQTVAELGGFIQDASVDGRSVRRADGSTAVVDRWANYTVRIPAARFNDFLSRTGSIGNVTSTSRSAENVTSQYTDYQARLDSLTIQEERLLDMLEQSGELDSLIALEERLSEVRYEIESIERSLRNLDQRLSYSTVTLNIQEVEVYTPTATITRSFGEKLGDALHDGWNGFVRGLQNLVLVLAAALPALVLLAAIAVVVVLIVRRSVRRSRAARQAQPEAHAAQPAQPPVPGRETTYVVSPDPADKPKKKGS